MNKIMPSKKRNYQAEYQRRRQLGIERGLSIAQARGHARKSESKISELKRSGIIDRTRKSTLERYYQAINGIASGKSLSKASKEARISLGTIRKLDIERNTLHFLNNHKWEIKSSASFPILTKDGKLFKEVLLDRKNARIVGQYWNAAHNAYLGDTSAITTFSNIVVFDLFGNQYSLLTIVDDLISIMEQMNDADREAYERMFSSEQRAFRVMNHG
ncbi:hypothetical protein [Nitrosomonas ureae]|uniref:Uncharacterized protein n=1 Tax=Nitrosomonas ureae TaxID=44577 RepID=A0A1H5WJM9_9PROT|nr:hypothetical protein [Nitrosomonas ureae]SEF99491.1 hypothetical protein SAMN05216334_11910 [Nitrosomonas ureae]